MVGSTLVMSSEQRSQGTTLSNTFQKESAPQVQAILDLSDSRSRAARCPASTQLNRSQADWRDIPNAAPIWAQLTSRDRRISTTCCSWLPLPWMVSSIG